MDTFAHILNGTPAKGEMSMPPVVPPEPDAPSSGNRHYGIPYTRKNKLIKNVKDLKLDVPPSGKVCHNGGFAGSGG